MRTLGGWRGVKKLRRETTRENKVEEGKRDRGTWEDIFALSSRARSYYRHTWCNILPLIFASVRGFLLRPRRDFTSTHAVRDATGGSLATAGVEAEDDRMLPKFTKSREDDTSILSSLKPPHPFDSARVKVRTRVRSWREGRGLRDRAAGIVVIGLCFPLHVLPHCRISSIRVLQ